MASVLSTDSTNYTDTNGVTYTTTPTNDQLTSEDFITLMITELSMQDPTKPVDSSSMLDDQMQLSTLEANIAMTESMQSLATSFNQSALSDSANMIGHIVEDGTTTEDGIAKQYKVSSVASEDGEIYLKAYEILGYDDVYYFEPVDDASSIENGNDEGDLITLSDSEGNEYTFSTANKSYETLAEEINAIDGMGADVIETDEGQEQLIIAVNNGGSSISQEGLELKFSKDQSIIYNNEIALLPAGNITNIY